MKNISQVQSQEYFQKKSAKSASLTKRFSEREKGWNNRIIISEQILGVIPREYSNKKILPQIKGGTASIVQKYIQMHKNQQELEYLVECEQKIFETKLEQVRQVHKLYNVPKIHQNVFNEILSSSNDKLKVLEEELKLMDQKLSPILHCIFTITARENCLNLIQNQLRQQKQEEKEKLMELIYDYRILSLNTLESIVKWQQYVENKNICIQFSLDDDDIGYCQRFYSDYEILRPQLIKFIEVSESSDPFFVKQLGSNQTKLYARVRRAEVELLNLYELYKPQNCFEKILLERCIQLNDFKISRIDTQEQYVIRGYQICGFSNYDTLRETMNLIGYKEVQRIKKDTQVLLWNMQMVYLRIQAGGHLAQQVNEAKGNLYLKLSFQIGLYRSVKLFNMFTIGKSLKEIQNAKIFSQLKKVQLNQELLVKLEFSNKTIEKAKIMVVTTLYYYNTSLNIIYGKPYTFMPDIWSSEVIMKELCALQHHLDDYQLLNCFKQILDKCLLFLLESNVIQLKLLYNKYCYAKQNYQSYNALLVSYIEVEMKMNQTIEIIRNINKFDARVHILTQLKQHYSSQN
ncbi:unnamed protein product [Paramecium sonneborni]|uniref:Uncharacterized protein n=1 Tax=Paramecium sonneborni TaxID=65129 RepID=A0A8S1RIQ3_9CILI|nr:unnamed protein product [Paramecium sonneborni]